MLFRNGINNVTCRLEIGMCFGDSLVQLKAGLLTVIYKCAVVTRGPRRACGTINSVQYGRP